MQNKKPMLQISQADYLNISKQINENGSTIEYEKDGLFLCFDYAYTIEGYRENDYFNGTGGFVETSRNLEIYNVGAYDEYSIEVDTDFDENKLESYVM